MTDDNTEALTAAKSLLEPLRLGALRLRNRIAMAPMTREMSPDGVPTAAVADYYRRFAAGGVGLIITEGTATDSTGAFGAAVPRLYGDAALAGWRAVVEAVHAEGAAIIPQLWHVGAFEPSMIGMTDSRRTASPRLSPSGLAAPQMPAGRAMTQADIDATIDAFAAAVMSAKSLGFDGVELHAGHGYLFDQFFWSGTNLRTDRYGMADRTRFAVEVIAECRHRAGPDFPICLRFSQWKQLDYAATLFSSPQELENFLTPLAAAGVDIFHCSTRRFWEPAFKGSDLTLGGWTRRLSGRPAIVVGSVTLANDFKSADGKRLAEVNLNSLEQLARLRDREEFDIVAIGRALLANPDWAKLLAAGRMSELRNFANIMLERL